jgi:hypothetical protein
MGCFRSSEGFSQAVPESWGLPRLILLLFGGIPNSPRVVKCRSSKCYWGAAKVESDQGGSTGGWAEVIDAEGNELVG